MNCALILHRMRLALTLALSCAAGLAGHAAGGGEHSRPSILLLLADDLGYGDLGCQGATDLRTPHLDELAASGIRLDSFYANCTVCSPTRASLLTGRFPDLVGVPGVIRTHPNDSWGWLDPRATLLPQALKPAGYHCALIGKWHLGLESPNTPDERGFDHFHGFLGDMMDDYYTHLRHGRNYLRRNAEVIEAPGHASDLFSDWAIAYLDERREEPGPFFLYLAYNAPHTPIQPPADWLARVKDREPGMNEKRASLVALIEHMDDGIGRVLAALGRNGQAENTLVLFTSDNGGQLSVGANNGPWRGGKQDMYEGGLRVPMIARWPGRIPAGAQSSALTLTMDLFATCAEAAGVSVPAEIEAVSILPTLLGQPQVLPDRDLVWMRREGNARYQGRDYFAFRRGDWKLVQNSPLEPWQLFNLAEDPGELRDLSEIEGNRRWQLTQGLMRHVQRAGRVPWQQP